MFAKCNFMLKLAQNVAFSTENITIEIPFLLADRTLTTVSLGRFWTTNTNDLFCGLGWRDHVALWLPLSLSLPFPSPSRSVFSSVFCLAPPYSPCESTCSSK